MDIKTLAAAVRAHYEALVKARGDAGATSTELALIAGALLVGAGLLVAAVRSKLAEKIGIISGG
ncbi:hypothetical protein ACFWGM_01860 [Streptomyces roseolus]|uniref:hypothetical protein n=1 Tax=Streptomyces roseolus TaxID=67358 RepID=UPI003641A2D2